jgi:hypothetical protein
MKNCFLLFFLIVCNSSAWSQTPNPLPGDPIDPQIRALWDEFNEKTESTPQSTVQVNQVGENLQLQLTTSGDAVKVFSQQQGQSLQLQANVFGQNAMLAIQQNGTGHQATIDALGNQSAVTLIQQGSNHQLRFADQNEAGKQYQISQRGNDHVLEIIESAGPVNDLILQQQGQGAAAIIVNGGGG